MLRIGSAAPAAEPDHPSAASSRRSGPGPVGCAGPPRGRPGHPRRTRPPSGATAAGPGSARISALSSATRTRSRGPFAAGARPGVGSSPKRSGASGADLLQRRGFEDMGGRVRVISLVPDPAFRRLSDLGGDVRCPSGSSPRRCCPLPRALSARTEPPCCRAYSLHQRQSDAGALEAAACAPPRPDGTARRSGGARPAGMPVPVSVTDSSTRSPFERSRTAISPAKVNLKALETRLRTIFSHCLGSTWTGPDSGGQSTISFRPADSTSEVNAPASPAVNRARSVGSNATAGVRPRPARSRAGC